MKYYVTSKISENIHETPEKYLLCIGVPIARTGEMIYGENETPLETDDQGRVIVDREESEVFRPETIASFEGKPVTISHPKEFVSPENWKQLAKGILQNVRRGEGENKNDLLADLLITDSIAIELVKNGLREVSCGYEADYEQLEEGRGKQTNIIGNHLALVDQGRAGPQYAINDHKLKESRKMKLNEKIKAIFAKAQDEALKVADEDMPEKKEEKSKDAASYDELVKMVKDLGEKIESMSKPKDNASGIVEKKEDKSEDADEDKKDKEDKSEDAEEGSLEDRLKALEECVSKLMEGEAMDSDEDKEDEESEDDDFDESAMVGDEISRAEILAPGLKPSKDLKVKALKAAYDTKEGKRVIEALTGGKAPTYDSKEKVNALFMSASEVMKVSRKDEFKKTKVGDYKSTFDNDKVITAEKMNELNAKFYKRN